MAAFKNKDNGTWYVQFRYTDWKGERQQKLKRGFATKREALEWEREFLMENEKNSCTVSCRNDDNLIFFWLRFRTQFEFFRQPREYC